MQSLRERGAIALDRLTTRTAGRTIGQTMSETHPSARAFHETVAPYAVGEPSTPFVKISVSLPADLVAVVRSSAEASGLSVSATIAAALRRTLEVAEQERLDGALAAQADENAGWADAYLPIARDLLATLEW